MNKIPIVFAVAATSIFSSGFRNKSQEFRDAVRYGAETKVVFHVVDDEGQPVKDASVSAAFYMHEKKDNQGKGLTDENGFFEAVQQSVGEVNYWVRKDDSYTTKGRIWFAGNVHKRGEVKDGRWQPYGKTYKVVLKKKRNPHSMFITPTRNWIDISQTNVVMGFDLEKNAFVKPHGNGETTDFELEFQSDGKKYLEHTGSRLKVRFVRSFDGFYIAKRDTYSTFWSAYHADTNSIFKQELSLFTQKKANGKWQRNELEEDAYLVVRTRSTVDKKGNLKSAHYSKIGRLKFSIGETTPGCVLLFYYYNPIANDANLELDYSKRIRPLK